MSGGERGRLALAKLALEGANLLLLDEPTNHLDIDSQDVLQDVLAQFDGTILLASHDRYLIDALATQIWQMTPGELSITYGGYQEYLRARNRRLAAAVADEKAHRVDPRQRADARLSTPTKSDRDLAPYQAARRAEELEATIHALETHLGEITALSWMGRAGPVTPAQLRTLGETYARAEAELEAALEEWGSLAD